MSPFENDYDSMWLIMMFPCCWLTPPLPLVVMIDQGSIVWVISDSWWYFMFLDYHPIIKRGLKEYPPCIDYFPVKASMMFSCENFHYRIGYFPLPGSMMVDTSSVLGFQISPCHPDICQPDHISAVRPGSELLEALLPKVWSGQERTDTWHHLLLKEGGGPAV